MPYVVARVNWLAASSRERGSRLGTAASLAGVQICDAHWARNSAMAAQVTTRTELSTMKPTIGIEANSTNRATSETTIVYRRSNRSAITPESGPRMKAGRSCTAITEPNAAPFAVAPGHLRRRERGTRQQAQPVAQGGEPEHQEEPTERPDPQCVDDLRQTGALDCARLR